MATRSGWVRLGTDTTWVMLALGLGLAAAAALAVSAPVSELVYLTSAMRPEWWVTALWAFVVLGAAISAPLVILSNRPLWVNLDEGLVRVASRTVPISELRHAFRMPGGATADQFVVQLEIVRGLDARLPVRSAALPNLTADQLEALLELVRRAPILPKPGFPVRSPLAGELGQRSGDEQVADEVSDALQSFGRVSYAKPTLVLELEDALERARRSSDPETHGPLPSEWARVAAAALRGPERLEADLLKAPARAVPGTSAESDAAKDAGGPGRRRRAVEEWIAQNGGVTTTHSPSRVLGWVIIVAALLTPVILSVAVVQGVLFFGAPVSNLMAWWGTSILTWPLFVWLGVVLLKRARALRNSSARRAALVLSTQGTGVPDFVLDHFAEAKLERSYGVHVYLLGIVLFVALLASGLLFLSLSADMVGGPYAPLPWHAPLGWLLLIPAIPVFVGVLRWQRYMQGQLVRAQVEWRLLGNSLH